MTQAISRHSSSDQTGDSVAFAQEWDKEGREMDLRPLIGRGEDPLARVIAAAEALPQEGTLVLATPFDPRPLRRVLARKGFSTDARRIEPGHWRVTVTRDGRGSMTGEDAPPAEACAGDADTPVWEADGLLHVDVRGLTPPLPMLAILRLIHSLEAPRDIVVHHEREPHFLIPELAEIGWGIERVPGDPGEVRLRLRPAS